MYVSRSFGLSIWLCRFWHIAANSKTSMEKVEMISLFSAALVTNELITKRQLECAKEIFNANKMDERLIVFVITSVSITWKIRLKDMYKTFPIHVISMGVMDSRLYRYWLVSTIHIDTYDKSNRSNARAHTHSHFRPLIIINDYIQI